MPYVNINEQRKVKANSIIIAKKFLSELNNTVTIQDSEDAGIDFVMTFGQGHKKISIFLLAARDKASDMFISAYNTKKNKNADILNYKASLSHIYSSKANFLFFLSGKRLFILPMLKFRKWFTDHTDTFQSECYTTISGNYEIKSHGFLVPLNRLKRDFIVGNAHASIYLIDDDPNSNKIKGYVQEI